MTTSLKVIKSFILNADVHRGPQFLRFKVRRNSAGLTTSRQQDACAEAAAS